MSLYRYFQAKTSLPSSSGPLSATVPSTVIAQANRAVLREISNTAKETLRKRGSYSRYSPEERAAIGKYAALHGTSAAAAVFSSKLNKQVSASSVQYMKQAYVNERKRNRDNYDDIESISSLPTKKRGKPLLLGECMDAMVQKYLQKVREAGGVVTARVALAAARAIILSQDRTKLMEFGGHIDLNLTWAYSLLSRMKFVTRRATTSKSKFSPENFAQLKADFLDDLSSIVELEDIPPELVLNWDQTGIKLVPISNHTMDRQGLKRIEVAGIKDKRLITAVFCGSLTGDFLPMQVVYKGKTKRCHPKYSFPNNWSTPNHWSTEQTMLEYVADIIVPYVNRQRELLGEEKSAVVIMDNFTGQITAPVEALLEENKINVCLLPANTTDRLQPLDVSVNKPAKDFLRHKFEEWYTEQIMKQLDGQDLDTSTLVPIDVSSAVMKEVSAKWLADLAEYMANNPQIIVNGFEKTGITAALGGEEDMEENMSDSCSEGPEEECEDYVSEDEEFDYV